MKCLFQKGLSSLLTTVMHGHKTFQMHLIQTGAQLCTRAVPAQLQGWSSAICILLPTGC